MKVKKNSLQEVQAKRDKIHKHIPTQSKTNFKNC